MHRQFASLALLFFLACYSVNDGAQQVSPSATKPWMDKNLIRQASPIAAYMNPRLSATTRAADLLRRMTTKEKIGQLLTLSGWNTYAKVGDNVTASTTLGDLLQTKAAGSLYGVLRADPWTKVTLAMGLPPRQSAEAVNAIQYQAVATSRLHIPLFLAEECSHGHMAIGATVFPVPISQASTWDPLLLGRMAHAVAQETKAAGANICYGPILDVARELRWSRVEETLGEDPFLISTLGSCLVRGLQGDDLAAPDSIIATVKHFAGYGQPEGGHNQAETHAGPREVQTIFLPAFHEAVSAGARSVMSSYNEIDGVPSTANRVLLTHVLRDQWKFRGFVVSDGGAIDGLSETHRIARNTAAAAELALAAGVDSDLGGNAFWALHDLKHLPASTRAALDRSVERVLRAKFEAGIFEHPYVDPERAATEIGSKAHRLLARQIAAESIVLLRNQDSLLPLSKRIRAIAVIGPNADNPENQLGDYTAPQPAGSIVTVLGGIRNAVSPETVVRYAQGCSVRGVSTAGFADALAAVRQSDVAIVVLGGSSTRSYGGGFDSTGAGRVDSPLGEQESGEGFDRLSLDLPGVQDTLLRQIVALGKPTILVRVEGRPLNTDWAAAHVPAILEAWYPGEEGGNAIADVIFGDHNPAGRMPVSMPSSVGQLPVYYNGDTRSRRNYVEGSGAPLFSFGYGLSYSSFAYSDLRIRVNETHSGLGIDVDVDITNTGKRDGDEVAQLYLRPDVATVVTPFKTLKGFARLHISAGQTITHRFSLDAKDLAIYSTEDQWVVEPGVFHVVVGRSSSSLDLQGQFEIRRRDQLGSRSNRHFCNASKGTLD
jgi:beta-glucosidase